MAAALVGAAARGLLSARDGAPIVYTGEHYVVDVLLGWIYAAVCFVAVQWIARPARGAKGRHEEHHHFRSVPV